MVKKCVYLLALLVAPAFSQAQEFNDAPGRDDENYLALIFPKTVRSESFTATIAIPVAPTIAAQNLVDFAHQFIGTPYHSGGTSANGFDCSGFTRTVFKQIGLELPHSSTAQSNLGEKISLEEVRAGDLLFFTGGNKNSGRVGHVAMVSEITPEGEIKMIHATIHGGVMVDKPFTTAYYKPRYICARRVLKENAATVLN